MVVYCTVEPTERDGIQKAWDAICPTSLLPEEIPFNYDVIRPKRSIMTGT